MRFVPTDVPYKVYDTVIGYVSGTWSTLSAYLPKRRGHEKNAISHSTIVNGAVQNGVAQNGVACTGKKGAAILDGPVESETRLFPVEFEWTGPGDNVFVTGSFYGWTVKIPLNKKSNKFYAKIELPKGRHEFKFIVNGVWKNSLRYPTTVNGYGDYNNYIDI